MYQMKYVSCLEGGGPAWKRVSEGLKVKRTRKQREEDTDHGQKLSGSVVPHAAERWIRPVSKISAPSWEPQAYVWRLQWSPLSFRNLTPDPSLLLLNYNSPLLCASPNMTLVLLFLYWTGCFRCNLLPFRLTLHCSFLLLDTVQPFLYIFISSRFVLMVAYK